MKVKISNNIIVPATPEILKHCNNNLVLDNPEYITKEKMGFYIGNTPKKLYLYEKRGNEIILPFGCIKTIWNLIKDYNIETDFASNSINIKGEVSLYNYQKIAVKETLKAKNGVLISPAGSGKTQMAIGVIAKLKQKTLWVTHTNDLLKQSKDRLKQYLDCKVGTIAAGKVDIQDVTFATVQTMCKMNLESVKDEFGLVIVDECHRLASSPTKMTMFGKVVSNLKARYKIGITATAWRSDGMVKSLFAYLGEIFYEVSKETVANKTMKADINFIQTDFELEKFGPSFESDGTVNYVKMIEELTQDKSRNKLIADCIKATKNVSCLILSARLDQLREIKDFLGHGVMIDGSMTSKKGKLAREQAIKDMQDGKEKVLFASYNLAKEGLDIPCLERLFLASPQKDYAVIIQSVGRIERKAEKESPVVYDFVDKVGMCMGMYKKRKSIYKKNNNKIIQDI